MMNTTIVASYRVLPNYRNTPFINKDDRTMRIKKFLMHPSFNLDDSYFKHDIALALLDKADTRKGKILLRLPNVEPRVYSKCTLMGLGSVGADNYPKVMRDGIVSIRSDTECLRELGNVAYSPGDNLCVSSNQGATSCPGDLGGPVVWSNPADGESYLVGVTSTGRMPCLHFPYTTVVNVARVMAFIEQAKKLLMERERERFDQTDYSETGLKVIETRLSE